MATVELIGHSGRITGRVGGFVTTFHVLILGDDVVVSNPLFDRGMQRFPVPNCGTRISELAARPGFRIRLAATFDDTLLYLSDRNDEDFGYALNLTSPDLSEWGYCR